MSIIDKFIDLVEYFPCKNAIGIWGIIHSQISMVSYRSFIKMCDDGFKAKRNLDLSDQVFRGYQVTPDQSDAERTSV